jgi:shikimate dehydrogenase
MEPHAEASQGPDRYGVVGHPVAHSRSPFIHGIFARQTEQDLVYRLYDVGPDDFDEFCTQFFGSGGRGLNVTVPHKAAAAAFADELTPRAGRAGAVNTLAKREDGLLGDNTDGAGLVRDLVLNLGLTLERARILILGAGGATRGILAPLLEQEPEEIVIGNRTAERAQGLAGIFGDLGSVRGCGFDELPRRPFDLILNATSAGLSGAMPRITTAVVSGVTTCYDLSYGKGATPFVSWARDNGCAQAVEGWGMLVEQAAESFELWRGVRPETAPVLSLLAGPR